jgi:hypothetical protein
MVNLRNRNLIQPPARLQGANVPPLNPPPHVPPLALPLGGRGAGVGAGRGARVRQQQAQPLQVSQPIVNEYHNMLGHMGLSVAAITSLENLGLDNIQNFSEITEKDIPSIVKEVRRNNTLVRQTSQNYLHSLRYWVMRQERLQVNYTSQEFDEVTMRESFQRYQTSLDTTSQELIKAPEKFKDKNKWRDFSEAFFTFMQNSKGQCDFPLSYILREHDDPDDIDPRDYATIEAYEEAIVPFSGAHYDVDNCMVFDSLKSYVLGGPHWTWIQDFERTRDGRSAWLTLKEHFNGPGSKIRLKAAAYAAIKRAEYKGAKNFDYELYRRIHTQAHSDLARYGEPVPETKKVKDFLDGITDSTLQPVKYTIAGFSHLMQNFHEAANYIGNIIDLNKKSEYTSRNISSTSSGRGGGRARGGRGRGRGRESGRSNNGRGRGRGRGRGGRNSNNPGRWISADEWSNMAEDEKETIRNARANYAKRNISALITEEDTNTTDHEPWKPQLH